MVQPVGRQHLRENVRQLNIIISGFKNDTCAQWSPKPAKALIKHLPHGAYSTCRSAGWNRIFQYNQQIERLRNTHEQMFNRSVKFSEIEEIVRPNLSMALTELKENIDSDTDFRFSIHLDKEFQLHICGEALPQFPHAEVIARQAKRTHGSAKNSKWIYEKQQYLQGFDDYDEVLMVSEDGKCTEGLETNFIAIHGDNTIETAPLSDGVLDGTVRNALVELCAEKKLKLKETAPHITKFHTWKSAAVLSTSRLLLPVHSLELHSSIPWTKQRERTFEVDGFVEELEGLIESKVYDFSTPI